MRKCPCKDCDLREVGCHIKCQEYKEYIKYYKKISKKIKMEKIINSVTWI